MQDKQKIGFSKSPADKVAHLFLTVCQPHLTSKQISVLKKSYLLSQNEQERAAFEPARLNQESTIQETGMPSEAGQKNSRRRLNSKETLRVSCKFCQLLLG